MTLNINNISIVHWFPNCEKHKCGYCKSEDGSISYGMWADTMTVKDYQTLIDRGWRRSGKYCYKPIMKETCCPQYTIRCDALNFKISKSHKKIIKKFNKFLNDGSFNTNEKNNELDTRNFDESMFHVKDRPNINIDYKNLNIDFNDETNKSKKQDFLPSHSGNEEVKAVDHQISTTEIANKKVKVTDDVEMTTSVTVKEGIGADPNKPPCKKAKILRLEKKRQKMHEKGLEFTKTRQNNESKSLEQFLNDISDDMKHKLKTELISTSRNDIFTDFDTEYELYRKYQMIIHNDPPQKCTKKAFSRFLVNTPLKAETWENHNELGYGSFHQQYWLDDKLIAVGVIDILPKCVSSVYFFYDPDYRNLTLGTYGSLREIDFTCKLNQIKPNIDRYYMGYYIHSCQKMRYKGKLIPSDLLCPETYKWFSISDCIKKLELNKYNRFNEDLTAVDEDCCSSQDIDRIKIYLLDGYIHYGSYKHKNSERNIYQNIGKLIGKNCLETMLFVKQ